MSKQLIIIGAGGHGRVVADIARLRNYESIAFLDDNTVENVNQIGRVSDFEKYIETADFFVAIGNNKIRKTIFENLNMRGCKIVNLLHPSSIIAADVILGKGIAVMAGAVINTGSQIRDGGIINTCSSIDHDCLVGAFSHISVGSHLAGAVTIGEESFIGAGATVINNISICKDCTIGAGAVVIKNIPEPGVYTGVPARKMK